MPRGKSNKKLSAPAASAVRALVARDIRRTLQPSKVKKHPRSNDRPNGGMTSAPSAQSAQMKSHMRISGRGKSRSGHDTVTYEGRDVVALLASPTSSLNDVASANLLFAEELTPSNSVLFPRLSAAALMFERFRVRKVRLSYVPTCATSMAGAVLLGIQTDPAKGVPGDVVRALQLEHAVSAAPWMQMCTPDMIDDRELFLSSAAVESGIARNFGDGADLVNSSQQRLTSCGHAFVLGQGISTNGNVGYLTIEYVVELINPIAPPSVTFSGTALTNQIFDGDATPGTDYSPLLSIAALAQLGYWAYNLYNNTAPGQLTTTTTGPLTSYNSLVVEAAQYLVSYYLGLDAVAALEEKKVSDREYQVVIKRPSTQSWRHPKLRRSRRYVPSHDEVQGPEPPKPLAAGDITVTLYLVTNGTSSGTETSVSLYTKVFSAGTGALTISDSLPLDLTNFLAGPYSGTLGFDGNYSGRLCMVVDPTGSENRQIATPGQWDSTYFNIVELPEQQLANQ